MVALVAAVVVLFFAAVASMGIVAETLRLVRVEGCVVVVAAVVVVGGGGGGGGGGLGGHRGRLFAPGECVTGGGGGVARLLLPLCIVVYRCCDRGCRNRRHDAKFSPHSFASFV